MSNSSDSSPVVKGGLAVIAGGSAIALGASYWQRWEVVAILVVGGALVVGLLLLVFRVIQGSRERSSAKQLAETIGSRQKNQDISSPEDRAKIDQLGSKFQEGIDIYRAAGKNLYSLPWYVLVGEPGSGKTEMLRHSDVPVPQGLSDLPGVGGTINMNWWFTERAVVLDTAGRIMFQQVEAGKTTEWKSFLELLRKARSNCPINGLLLVIPAESLIRDSQGKVVEKARKIARQFDLIQRTLDIRFPVFIVVTKSDLINGFRSFFERVDIRDQGQMLGWSNPSQNLDEVFDPEEIDRHLSDVRQRLLKRRTGLLLDPVSKQDPGARRADEVDDLYAFPDALMTIGPRLQLYLSTIFVAGEWSPKPLFLRGIYFTSSMRQGAALDTELAHALGLPVESLPEGRQWKQDESYFLKDMFLRKVFPEKGLVTRQTKAQGLDSRRKAVVLTAASLAVVALLALTYFGKQQMEQAILSPAEFWKPLAENYEKAQANRVAYEKGSAALKETDPYWQIVRKSLNYGGAAGPAGGELVFEYAGGRQPYEVKDDKVPTVAALHKEAMSQVKRELAVPVVFKPVAFVEGSLSAADRRDAYRTILDQTVLVPLVEAAQKKMAAAPAGEKVTPEAAAVEADALRQLIRIEAMAAGASSPDAPQRPAIELRPLFRYVLPDAQFAAIPVDHLVVLQDAVDWCYGSGKDADGKDRGGAKFPPADAAGRSLLATKSDDPNDQAIKAIDAGVARFNQFWGARLSAKNLAQRDADVVRLRQKLAEVRDQEVAIREYTIELLPTTQKDVTSYNNVALKLKKYVSDLEGLSKAADDLLAKVKGQKGGWSRDDTMLSMFAKELRDDIRVGGMAYTQLRAEAQESARLRRVIDALRVGREGLPSGENPPIDESAKAEFTTLQESFLWPQGQPAEVPAYRRYTNGYRVVTDRLPDLSSPAGTAGPGPTASDAAGGPVAVAAPVSPAVAAAAATGSLDEQLTAIRKGVDQVADEVRTKVQAGGLEQAKKVQAACVTVEERLGAPARRYQAVSAVLSRLPTTLPAFAAEVANAAKAQGRGARKLDPLPLTNLGAGVTIDPQYDAAAAKVPLGLWEGASGRLEALLPAADPSTAAGSAPASADPVLDAKGLRERLDNTRRSAVNPYLAVYAAYWCDLAEQARTVPPTSWKVGANPAKDWADYAGQLPDGKAANVAIGKVRAVVANALMQVAAAPSDKARVTAVLASTQTADASSSPEQLVPQRELESRSGTAMDGWRRLGRKEDGSVADAVTAANRAEAMGAQRLWDDLLIVGGDSLSADYWSRVTKLGFDVLVKATPDRDLEIKSLAARLGRFPLTPPKAGERALTGAEVQALKAEVAAYAGRVAAADKGRSDLAGKAVPAWYPEGFGKLVAHKPTAADEPRLRRGQLILDACGGDVKFYNVPVEKQQQLVGTKNADLVRPFQIALVRMAGGQWGPKAYPPDAASANQLLGSLALSDATGQGGAAKFEMNEGGPTLVNGRSQLKELVGAEGPWAALQLLYGASADVRPEPLTGPPTAIWYVEFRRTNFPKPGLTTSVWVKVEFPKPLPVNLR